MRLTVLHFNDAHGRLERLPRLFTLIARQRAAASQAGRRVLILEAGDSSDRNCWESDITQGRANFTLLDAMGVQASVVGNGEALQWGRPALGRLAAAAHFPLLAANLIDCADPARLAVPGLQASTLFDFDGFRVGVTGATARYGSGYQRFGYDAVDPLPGLRREIAALQAHGARLIILLSHLGCWSPEERLSQGIADEINDYDVAQACPEIALIVGGHSHRALEQPWRVGETLIVQAGEYGRYLGQVDLDLDPATGRVTGYAGQLHPCDDRVPPDPTVSATLELVREEAARLLDAPVAALSHAYAHTLDTPSPVAAWMAEALREVGGADLALLFSGFARRGLAAGPLRRRDLYEAFPGGTHVTAAVVSGAQIARLLNRMLASPYRTASFNPKRGEPPLGLPAASANVDLRYDLTRPAGDQLLACRLDGAPLEPARRYRLASTYYTLSDITADPEYDFIGLEPGQRIELVRVEQVLWEIMEDWLRQRGTVETKIPAG